MTSSLCLYISLLFCICKTIRYTKKLALTQTRFCHSLNYINKNIYACSLSLNVLAEHSSTSNNNINKHNLSREKLTKEGDKIPLQLDLCNKKSQFDCYFNSQHFEPLKVYFEPQILPLAVGSSHICQYSTYNMCCHLGMFPSGQDRLQSRLASTGSRGCHRCQK